MKTRSIRVKINLAAGLCLLATAAVIIGVAAFTLRTEASEARQVAVGHGMERVAAAAREFAGTLRAQLEEPLDATGMLAQVLVAATQRAQDTTAGADWGRIERRCGSDLERMVEVAHSLVRPYVEAVQKGQMPLADAQKQTCERLRALRYDGGTGYMWINDMTEPIPTMVMHPIIPALEGLVMDKPEFNCAMGKNQNLFQAFVEVCKSKGCGFVNYVWPKPTKDGATKELMPKLSFVKLVPEWKWVLGTGIYVTDAALELTRDDVTAILRGVLEANPQYVAIYTCWEPDAFDAKDSRFKNSPGHDATGRFLPYWSRDDKGALTVRALADYDKEGAGDFYLLPRTTKQAYLHEPFVCPVQGKDVLVASLVVPILVRGEFRGIAGIDLRLDSFQKTADTLAAGLYDGSAAVQVIGNKGTVAAASGTPELVGRSMQKLHADWEEDLAVIRKGEDRVEEDEGRITAFAALRPEGTATPWGVLVTAPEDKITAQADRNMAQAMLALWFMLGIGVACAVGALLVLGRVTGGISKPLVEASRALVDMESRNDLTRRLTVAARDEIGDLGGALNRFLDKVQAIIKNVGASTSALAATSTELSASSSQMALGAKNASTRAGTVTAAAEEMSATATSIAAGMEETTSSLTTVASATEEMTATVTDLAANAEKARTITAQATTQAQGVGVVVKRLGESAQEIGQVSETITSISEQTNLLALNATIEAARAGAAGKGFAVVANEIKELAQQTAHATEDIKAKVEGIQSSTAGTIADIEKITGVITEVNDIVSTIATAITEQAAVTKDIAGNIAQASTGVRDANERTAQSTTASQAIAKDITVVNEAASEVSAGTAQVQASAAELSRMAEQLKAMVAQFTA